ncbi:MAG: hypothetical protein L0Z53_17380 [Acidobacteriales bacterium]|nr:hypothetical protein [Terriglobales bacterium]
MTDVSISVSLADLQELDKGAVHDLLVAAMRTGSIDAQEAVTLASECDVELIS